MDADEVASAGAGTASVPPAQAVATAAPELCCEECASGTAVPEQMVYAIGRLEVRFPSLGVEREYQQRLARTPAALKAGVSRASQVRAVLEAHGHLAMGVCFVFMVGGVPAFVVAPLGSHTRAQVMDALEHAEDPDYVCVLIGRAGPMSSPAQCGGVVAPIAAASQIYDFSLEDWGTSLLEQLGPALKAKKVSNSTFQSLARDVFRHVVNSTENLGVSDVHRALNYALVQHPGLPLAAAERAGSQQLDRIETRIIHGLGSRRQVAIVLTFVDLATGVSERLFTRIDVTEQWPFVADDADGGRAPLGLEPFVETGSFGLGF
jgi:hypothetical protein